MKRAALFLTVLALTLMAGQVTAGVTFYSSQAAFEAQGTILLSHNFDDFDPSVFTDVSEPFTRGDVTYTSADNLIVGTGTVYAPVRNLMAFNGWTPMTGDIATGPAYDMFGFKEGLITTTGIDGTVDVTVDTNLGSYTFLGLVVPQSNVGLGFLGFVADAGEHFTGFRVDSVNGVGWAPGMTDIELGRAGAAAVPEPASLALCAFGVAGLAGHAWRRRRNASVV